MILWSVAFAWRATTWLSTPVLVLRDVRKSHPGDILFRQDYKKAMAKLFILFSVTSFFGVGMSWHFMSRDISDTECQKLIDTEILALQIGAVVGVTSCIVFPLLVWQWPWTLLLMIDMIIFTAVITANWGDWTTVTWQAGILVAFNIGAVIAYYRARRYAMVMWTSISLALGMDFSGQLVTRTDIPIERRLDAWWCSCPTQCGFRLISISSLVLLFLVYNALLQVLMDKQDEEWRQQARTQRFVRIAREAAQDEAFVRSEQRRTRNEAVAERVALEQMRKREQRRAKRVVQQDSTVTPADTGAPKIKKKHRLRPRRKGSSTYYLQPRDDDDDDDGSVAGELCSDNSSDSESLPDPLD